MNLCYTDCSFVFTIVFTLFQIFLKMAAALADRAIGAIVGSAVADAAGINVEM